MGGIIELGLVRDLARPDDHVLLSFDVSCSGDLVAMWKRGDFGGKHHASGSGEKLLISRQARNGALFDDREVVPSFEVGQIAALSGRRIILAGEPGGSAESGLVVDCDTGETWIGALGNGVGNIGSDSAHGLWVGYADYGVFGGAELSVNRDISEAVWSGLAHFTEDLELVWCFPGKRAGAICIDSAEVVCVDADGSAIIWDGLQGIITTVTADYELKQLPMELDGVVGLIPGGGKLGVVFRDDGLWLAYGHEANGEFATEWIDELGFAQQSSSSAEHFCSRRGRLEVVADDRWFSATLSELVSARG